MTERWRSVASAAGLLDTAGAPMPTIFAEMTALATQAGAANLGQGFPDEDGPEWIREAAVEALRGGHNQYPPGRGVAALRSAIADHQERHYGMRFDPETEVLVTAGATEALASVILAFAGPEDEVVTLEPFYDAHASLIAMSGAKHVTVPLRPTAQGFALDLNALQSAVNERTKLILVNSPHNPTGAVLSIEELTAVAQAAQRVDAIVITDEVYEHLLFDGARHTPIGSLPGMKERTLTISSAGKTFSLTGWKIGWMCGPSEYIDAALAIKQFLTFSGGAPFQPAVARALAEGDDDVAALRESLNKRRELLIAGLESAGFTTVRPQGTYFVCADATPFLTPEIPDGAAFARAMPASIGVAGVPLSAFCAAGSETARELANWIRFTFVKDEETLREAISRLGKLASNSQ